MVWNISLDSWGLLYRLCLFAASCTPLACSLAGQYEKMKSPLLSVSTAQQQLKYWCVINIILKPKHNTVSATRKKFIPAETRTGGKILTLLEGLFGGTNEYVAKNVLLNMAYLNFQKC